MKTLIEKLRYFLEQKINLVLPLFIVITLFLEYKRIYANPYSTFFYIQQYFYKINLNFLNSNYFIFNSFPAGEHFSGVNILEFIFILVLVLSYILYYFSKGIEKRLLQFCFSIFFINSAISSILTLYFTIRNLKIEFGTLIYLLIIVFWTLFFYLILTILSKGEKVKTYKYRLLNDYTAFNLKRANKAQRIFHLVFDACFAILVTSNLIRILPIKSLRWLSNIIGERYVITLVFLVCITFYYIVFELIFKSTPAKFLTQTKVVSLTDQPITSGQIVAKSFSRRLPFNPLSFLTEQLGWHDSLSKTTVVQLTRQGKHGSWYWLIIPFFIGLFAIVFYATLYLRKYENFKVGENNYNNQKYDIERKLNNISEFDFITLSETNSRFGNNQYLKVGFIGKDSIDCYKINDSYSANSLQKADQYYGGYYNGLEVVTLSKRDLNNAICESYDFDGKFSDCGLKLLENQKAVRIKKIESLNEPTIDLDHVSFEQKRDGDYGFTIRLSNTDNKIVIENIKTDNKDILFTTTFPYSGADSYNKEKYSIKGSGLEPKQSVIFKLQIKDMLTEQRFIYSLEIEGRYTKTLKLVKSL